LVSVTAWSSRPRARTAQNC